MSYFTCSWNIRKHIPLLPHHEQIIECRHVSSIWRCRYCWKSYMFPLFHSAVTNRCVFLWFQYDFSGVRHLLRFVRKRTKSKGTCIDSAEIFLRHYLKLVHWFKRLQMVVHIYTKNSEAIYGYTAFVWVNIFHMLYTRSSSPSRPFALEIWNFACKLHVSTRKRPNFKLID